MLAASAGDRVLTDLPLVLRKPRPALRNNISVPPYPVFVLLDRALICYLHNPKIFFLEIPQGPLGISIGNIRSAQKAFRVPQSSVFCHFPCFVEISPKNGICSQNRIFWPIFKCHTILESYQQHGCRGVLQEKI